MKQKKIIRLQEIDSTNAYLRNYTPQDENESMTIVTTEYQSAGKGQGKNTWESNPGENLLFSILCHPDKVPANKQFALSMAIALAVKDALRMYIGDIEVKWPNDIYWHNHKLGGILIECSLSAGMVRNCIIGVGIDVNQRSFENLTKNPISIYQITHREIDRDELLNSIIEEFEHYLQLISDGRYDEIQLNYCHSLYRRHGYYPYYDKDGEFMARFVTIDPTGRLTLKDDDGMLRTYAFKEVKFLIEGKNVDI